MNQPEPLTRLSNSAVTVARDCKRKYLYSREMGLRRRGEFAPALHFGKLWHGALAEWFVSGDEDRAQNFIDWNAVDPDVANRCAAMLAGYVTKWPERPVCSLSEQELLVPIRNPATGRTSRRFSQFGFADMVALDASGKIWLWEHKTTSQIDGNTIEKLWSDSQITGYVAALRDSGIEVEGVVYDLAQKPRLKQKKTEDLDGFYQRLRDWHLADPPPYHREWVFISDRQVTDWREDIWQVTQELLSCRRTGYWYRNTGRCFDYFRPCEYAALCQNGASEALINAEYEPRETPSNNQPEQPIF